MMAFISKLWILVMLIAPLASASSLGVWPINPRIDHPASSTLLWVKNNNKTEPVTLQARVFLWRQANNEEQFEAQDELVISPPIIEVKPETQQIFRVMNRKGLLSTITTEKSYRILIDEVPKDDANQVSQLRFQMRYSLPLFVGRPEIFANKPITNILNSMALNLNYRVIQEPAPAIEIINNSPLHARLSNLTIYNNELPEKNYFSVTVYWVMCFQTLQNVGLWIAVN
ncbi:MAG: molecular chaperone [Gammaproteobacteria bacterium]|nr:MAG: molecular chaperone [Gammaproteobacteria bacterium]